ncbi:MAG: T9SS type A sorting domain-containing protein [Janthinobacterium lividum]
MRQFIQVFSICLRITFLVMWVGLFTASAQGPTWQAATAISPDTSTYSVVTATATDTRGNVYIAGYFYGLARFGSTTLLNPSRFDVFVAKWSSATQNFAWAKKAGGPGYDYAYALAVNGTSVYVAGSFQDVAVFGGTSLTSAGADDLYVTKLVDADSTADFVWTQRGGGNTNDKAQAIAVEGLSVYVTGEFGFTAQLGSITLGKMNSYFGNVFVAKLTDAGPTASFTWAQEVTITNGYVAALAVSGSSVYIAGSFHYGAGFGNTILRGRSINDYDAYVAKLTDAGPTGSFTWAQRAGSGGPGGDCRALALAVNGASIYAAGTFVGKADFGRDTLDSSNSRDIFITKLIDTGPTSAFTWVQQAGSPGFDNASALAVNGNNVYVGGNFIGTASFGNTFLSSSGGSDGFVANLTDTGPVSNFAWAVGTGSAGANVRAIATNKSGVYAVGSFFTMASFGDHIINTRSGDVGGFLAVLVNGNAGPLATAMGTAEAGMHVYPNPAGVETTVTISAMTGGHQASFNLLDALGRVVRTQSAALPAAGLGYRLNLAGLRAGVYTLRITAGNQVAATQRLVIE